MIFFQNNEKVVLAVARKKMSAQSTVIRGTDETDGPTPGPQAHTGVKVEKFFKSHLEGHCFVVLTFVSFLFKSHLSQIWRNTWGPIWKLFC